MADTKAKAGRTKKPAAGDDAKAARLPRALADQEPYRRTCGYAELMLVHSVGSFLADYATEWASWHKEHCCCPFCRYVGEDDRKAIAERLDGLAEYVLDGLCALNGATNVSPDTHNDWVIRWGRLTELVKYQDERWERERRG